MRRILLLPLVARCLETIDVCIWRMFVLIIIIYIYIAQYPANTACSTRL